MAGSRGEAVVFSGSLIDAQQAWSILVGHQIPARILDENIGVCYWPTSITVAVRGERAEAARELLETYGMLRPPPKE